MRSKLNLTSSDVNSLPSWNLTPRRSLNSQVVSLTMRQDSASAGWGCMFSSRKTSGLKMCWASAPLLSKLAKCGSTDSDSELSPIRSSAAASGPASAPNASATTPAVISLRIFLLLSVERRLAFAALLHREAGRGGGLLRAARLPDLLEHAHEVSAQELRDVLAGEAELEHALGQVGQVGVGAHALRIAVLPVHGRDAVDGRAALGHVVDDVRVPVLHHVRA